MPKSLSPVIGFAHTANSKFSYPTIWIYTLDLSDYFFPTSSLFVFCLSLTVSAVLRASCSLVNDAAKLKIKVNEKPPAAIRNAKVLQPPKEISLSTRREPQNANDAEDIANINAIAEPMYSRRRSSHSVNCSLLILVLKLRALKSRVSRIFFKRPLQKRRRGLVPARQPSHKGAGITKHPHGLIVPWLPALWERLVIQEEGAG